MGRNTPDADAVGMGHIDGACCGDKIGHVALSAQVAEGEIKESRGGPLDEAGVWAVVSPKDEGKEREMGGLVRGRRHKSREPTECWEKEKCIVHKDGEHYTMSRPRENGMLQILTHATFAGHAAK